MATSPSSVEVIGAEFLFGTPRVDTIRGISIPEVAVIGRSNVGKSSFINRLCGRRQLARVSGRPGSTRELNYYEIQGRRGDERFRLALVDMPGFGFAKLSKAEREQISELSVEFLRDRRRLKAVILLNDCRRLPEGDELAIQRICAEEGSHCLVVVTKTDVLRASEKARCLKDISRAYNLEPADILATGEKVPPQAVWDRLLPLIA